MNTASQALIQGLDKFRNETPKKSILYNGIQYNYYVEKNGPVTIFLLPGAIGSGEAMFPVFHNLAENYTILTLDYPEITDFHEFAAGIKHILDVEELNSCTFIGQSAGGILGQVFIRLFSSRVDNLILCHTTANTEDAPQKYIAEKVRVIQQQKQVLQTLPRFITHFFISRRVEKLLIGFPDIEKPFWRRYFKHLLRSRTIMQNLATLDLLISFANTVHFARGDLHDWNGHVVIIDSDRDKAVPQVERELVRTLYPEAEVIKMTGPGHLGIISHREEYLTIFRKVLNSH